MPDARLPAASPAGTGALSAASGNPRYRADRRSPAVTVRPVTAAPTGSGRARRGDHERPNVDRSLTVRNGPSWITRLAGGALVTTFASMDLGRRRRRPRGGHGR